MAHMIEFENSQHCNNPLCIACEDLFTDALDQTLSPADQAWFDRHIASCVECSERLADAQRGAAWLELLKTPRPEPSAALIERIIAQTSDRMSDLQRDNLLSPAIVGQPAMLPAAMPIAPRSNLLGFRPRTSGWMNPNSQPRLYMTAAMAFFSIALTLNLTGVRLDQLKASSLNPSSVRKTYYEASADAVRYYDNLRVVRVMESRVDDLRGTLQENRPADRPESARPESARPAAPAPSEQPKPETQPEPKPAQKDPNGPSSRNEIPAARFVNTSNLDMPGLTHLGRLSVPTRTTPISSQEGGLA